MDGESGPPATGEGTDESVAGIDAAFFDERTEGLQRLRWKRNGQQKQQ